MELMSELNFLSVLIFSVRVLFWNLDRQKGFESEKCIKAPSYSTLRRWLGYGLFLWATRVYSLKVSALKLDARRLGPFTI